MLPCRECQHPVSENAAACPQCGAPRPAKASWNGYGFEYKSKASIGSLPLLHISFKYRPNMLPVPARGVIAIGQFAVGIITIAQFGIGAACLSQFAAGIWAVGQFCLAWSFVGQLGLYLHKGVGMLAVSLPELLEKLLT
ncbi:MAG: zinc ribbon domain-containing protein [Candidatus Hydrogenedentes bacterium]|jgi:hypothetical protein|nr:zinc ribbon domain-containing protein [Candidatus Hydrogenedentota bacterium]